MQKVLNYILAGSTQILNTKQSKSEDIYQNDEICTRITRMTQNEDTKNVI